MWLLSDSKIYTETERARDSLEALYKRCKEESPALLALKTFDKSTITKRQCSINTEIDIQLRKTNECRNSPVHIWAPFDKGGTVEWWEMTLDQLDIHMEKK